MLNSNGFYHPQSSKSSSATSSPPITPVPVVRRSTAQTKSVSGATTTRHRPRTSPTSTSMLNTSGLLTTWSGSTAHSRSFRRVTPRAPSSQLGPDVIILEGGGNQPSRQPPSAENVFSTRRAPSHLAWHAKPNSLLSKSISAPHRSASSIGALLGRSHFGQPVIDVHAPTEWTITSLGVSIPAAREEDTSPSQQQMSSSDTVRGFRTNQSFIGDNNNDRTKTAAKNKHYRRQSRDDHDDTAHQSNISNLSEKNIRSHKLYSSSPASTMVTASTMTRTTATTTTTTTTTKRRYTSYIIRVVAGHKIWHVSHRYSDFEQLHISLRTTLGRSILPPLPPKYRLHFNNLDPSFVEKRREQLEVYIMTLVRIEQVWSCQRFMVDFLDNNIETLGMQTKYERMMRVQGTFIVVVVCLN